MTQEFHKTSNVNDTTRPAIVFGLGIIPPENNRAELGIAVSAKRHQLPLGRSLQDDRLQELLLPIGREYGSYEELRTYLHKQVDMLFDAHLVIGDFAPKNKE